MLHAYIACRQGDALFGEAPEQLAPWINAVYAQLSLYGVSLYSYDSQDQTVKERTARKMARRLLAARAAGKSVDLSGMPPFIKRVPGEAWDDLAEFQELLDPEQAEAMPLGPAVEPDRFKDLPQDPGESARQLLASPLGLNLSSAVEQLKNILRQANIKLAQIDAEQIAQRGFMPQEGAINLKRRARRWRCRRVL